MKQECVFGGQLRTEGRFYSLGLQVFFATALYFIMQPLILYSPLIHGALFEAYIIKPVKCALDECFMCAHNYLTESVLSAFKGLFFIYSNVLNSIFIRVFRI